MRSLGMPSDGKNGERDGGLCDLRVHYRYRPGPGLLAGRAAQVSCVFAIVSVFGNLASRKEKPPRTRHTPVPAKKFTFDPRFRALPHLPAPCALAPACAASSLLDVVPGTQRYRPTTGRVPGFESCTIEHRIL